MDKSWTFVPLRERDLLYIPVFLGPQHEQVLLAFFMSISNERII